MRKIIVDNSNKIPFDKWSALRPRLYDYIVEQDNYWENYVEDMAWYYNQYKEAFPDYFPKELTFCENNCWDDAYVEAYIHMDIIGDGSHYNIMLDYDVHSWWDGSASDSNEYAGRITDLLIKLGRQSERIINSITWPKQQFTFLNV